MIQPWYSIAMSCGAVLSRLLWVNQNSYPSASSLCSVVICHETYALCSVRSRVSSPARHVMKYYLCLDWKHSGTPLGSLCNHHIISRVIGKTTLTAVESCGIKSKNHWPPAALAKLRDSNLCSLSNQEQCDDKVPRK